MARLRPSEHRTAGFSHAAIAATFRWRAEYYWISPAERRASLPPPCGRRKRAMPAETHIFPCLKDNYGVLLHDPSTGTTAAIDAPEAGPVDAALADRGWRLTDILVTHHHGDHTGGIAELKKKHLCRVIAPRKEAQK